LAELISPGKSTGLYARRRSLQAAALVFTSPGIPMLFQGQEFMQGGSFTDWQTLDWQNTTKFSGIVQAYKHLINLRKNIYGNVAGLSGQSINIIHLNEESKILAYHRWDNGGPGDDVILILNFSNKTMRDYYINFPQNGKWKVRFNSDWKGYSSDFKDTTISSVDVENNSGAITIGPYSVLIFSQDV
jgi:1,4-alpha-glucan branching enzyme